MRALFAKEMHKKMSKNDRIWVLVNDLGYKMWDKVRQDFPNRFINVGAAEQTLIGVGVGLALNGKIPIIYSITSFLLYRPFETIRNYVNHEKIALKLIGAGRDKDYLHDGISHWSEEDKKIMNIFKNIHARWPKKIEEIPNLVDSMLKSQKPWYINLRR
jgi:transketolase